MKSFLKKYNLQLQLIYVLFLTTWSIFKLYSFSQNGKGMDLIGGVVIGVLTIFKISDFTNCTIK